MAFGRVSEDSQRLDRRTLLKALASVTLTPTTLLTACGDAADPVLQASAEELVRIPASFVATFLLPGAGRVRLDYQNEQNFSLSADAGPGSTIALDGAIYLYVAPSLASSDARLLRLGQLTADAPQPSRDLVLTPAPEGGPGPNQPGAVKTLYRADWPARPGDKPGESLVARIPALAKAQFVAGTRLRKGMDMGLCGDAVAGLISTWPSLVTGSGLAVVRHSSGIGLMGSITPLQAPIKLPKGLSVEDYRIRP